MAAALPARLRLAATLLAAVLAIALLAACGSSSADHPTRRVTRFVNLGLAVPSGWHLRRLQYRCGRAGLGLLIGDLSASRLNRIRHDFSGLPFGACTTSWNVSSLPADYVLVDITELQAPDALPVSEFPLSLNAFAPSRLPCHCSFRNGSVVTGNVDYDVRIWIGKRASSSDRQRLQDFLASIRPASA
jgi:hypothetical protein